MNKKNIIAILVLLAMLVQFSPVYPQPVIKPLQINDQVPDLSFDYMHNYTSGKAKLSDFKGKFIILDYWASWCVPCLKAMPKMEALQKKFTGDIQIIGLNIEKNEQTLGSILKRTPGLVIPHAWVQDKSEIRKLLPVHYLPHYIILDRTGKILAITDMAFITEENIGNLVAGKQVYFGFKDDIATKAVASDEKTGPSPSDMKGTVAYVKLNKYDPALKMEWKATKLGHIKANNMSLRTLFLFAFLGWEMDYRRLILEVDDPSEFVMPAKLTDQEKKTWKELNLFNYELNFPAAKDDSATLWKRMQEDLLGYFGYDASVQPRKTRCLVISGAGNALLQAKQESKLAGMDAYHISYRNQTLDNLVFNLKRFNISKGLPIVNESTFLGRIDLEVAADIYNIEELNRHFSKYGLNIGYEERVLDMLVISGKRYQ